jgi:hypothetical protein
MWWRIKLFQILPLFKPLPLQAQVKYHGCPDCP